MAWREDSDLHFKLILNNIPVIMLKDAVVVFTPYAKPNGVSALKRRKNDVQCPALQEISSTIQAENTGTTCMELLCNHYSIYNGLIALICKLWWLAISAAVIYLLLTLMFIIKRLSSASH